MVVVSRRSTRTPASSSTSAFTTISSAKRKLVISRPPMLTLPSWSSYASHMILSRKMLKRVGESRHPCRTPTVVLNHSPVLPLNRTALWTLSYRFSMPRIMLALMLYFLIVAHKVVGNKNKYHVAFFVPLETYQPLNYSQNDHLTLFPLCPFRAA